MIKKIFFFLFSLITSVTYGQGLQSPKDFLVSSFGENFTPHHLLVDYVEHVADNSDNVILEQYGKTNQDRPLLLAFITSKRNHDRLDQIRKDHLHHIGLMKSDVVVGEDISVVWLSFGVHGNEAGASESSMDVLYSLADPNNESAQRWLQNTVVILDPCINPDGYSRYTHWQRDVANKDIHPEHSDREHMEPWPGGRVNHYMFDLNRDWAWQTQIETQQRIEKYNKWMPHIHVDFHEMGHNQHYYFAPAAEPYHEFITDFQKDFQYTIGKNHAKYFDKEGWLYFTREVFDLFYPSYGDTYPTFNGAIGMTYEQAGGPRAGRAISMNNGDTLRLQDRIDHHTTTALSTVEVASENASTLVKEFRTFFSNSVERPRGKYKSYVIKAGRHQTLFKEYLKRNGIQYSYAQEGNARGYSYRENKDISFQYDGNDIVVNANQPKSTLLQVLMEVEPKLEDSLTYDITAWSLPQAMDLDAYGCYQYLETSDGDMEKSTAPMGSGTDKKYAYAFPYIDLSSVKLVSELLEKGFILRVANKDIMFGDRSIDRGSVLVVSADNKHKSDFDASVTSVLGAEQFWSIESGFAVSGSDIGGSGFSIIRGPKVLCLSGESTSIYGVGQVWHYFENVIDYPISLVDKDRMNRVPYDDYDVIILPEGYYSFNDNELEKLSSWVSRGGKLIAIGSGLNAILNKPGFSLKRAEKEKSKGDEKGKDDGKIDDKTKPYDERERRFIAGSLPGAIVRNKVDNSHPLAYGLGDHYYSLKTSRSRYALLQNGWNIVYVPENYESFGFIGSGIKKELDKTVSFAVEEKGRGAVVYMVDNPLFRGFWTNGQFLFSNALFLVN